MNRKIVCLLVGMLLISTMPVLGSTFDTKTKSGDPHPLLTSDNWPMFGHDPAHTSFSTSDAPDTNDILWVNTSGGVIQGSPIVVDDKVYYGSFDGNLYCLDAFEGTPIWVNSTGSGILFASPVYSGGKIIIGSTNGYVYCFDALDGSLNWTVSFGGFILSSPSAVEDKIFVGTSDGRVVCIEVSDGSIVWEVPLSYAIWNSPAVADDKLYIGLDDETIHCYNATDGSFIWMNNTNGVAGTPSVADSKVFIGSGDGYLSCFDAIDGTLLWENLTGGGISASSPSIAYNKVYIGTIAGNFSCFDATDGTLLWRNSTDKQIRSSAAIADNKVFFGSNNRKVYCFDAFSGTEIWNYETGNAIESSPSIYEGMVYIGSSDYKLYCFGVSNSPPDNPVIDGPSAAGPGFTVEFTAVSSDPEGGQIYYMWDWGDGNITEWLGPFSSGEPVVISRNWPYEGEYEIQVKVKDQDELETEWSAPFEISIAEQISLTNIKPGFIYFRFIGANSSYIFISFLETLSISVVLGDEGLNIVGEGTEHVNYTAFEVINYIWGDNLTQIDDNGSDGFSTHMDIPDGIWKLTAYAYDDEGRMIDSEGIDYVFFKSSASGEEQQLSRLMTFRNRIRNRIFNR